MQPSLTATYYGVSALIFWCLLAVFLKIIYAYPPFEILAIVFSLHFLGSLLVFKGKLFTSLKSTPKWHLVAGVLGLFGTNAFFISAFQFAPPAKVELINYLWPFLALLLSSLTLKSELKWNHIAGCLIAFYGSFLVLTNGQGLGGFQVEYLPGYLCAFLDACCWAVFTVSLKKHSKNLVESIGVMAGMTAGLAWISHGFFESFTTPLLSDVPYFLLMAATSHGLAYYFWDRGIKKGHYRMLCILSYFNPIVSVGLLIAFGYTAWDKPLVEATLAVSLGILIASENTIKAKTVENTA